MLKAPQVDVKTCKHAVRATNLANGRFLYRNPCQRAAGKWIGIYYGEIRVPHRFANLTNFMRAADLIDAKVYQTATRGAGSKQQANGELKGGRRE